MQVLKGKGKQKVGSGNPSPILEYSMPCTNGTLLGCVTEQSFELDINYDVRPCHISRKTMEKRASFTARKSEGREFQRLRPEIWGHI